MAVAPQNNLMSTRTLLLKRLGSFYKDADNFALLTDMLKGNKGEMGISLRLLDYFACTYSRVRNIQYALPDKALPFMVYDSYTQQLRSCKSLG